MSAFNLPHPAPTGAATPQEEPPLDRHDGDDEHPLWICRFAPDEPGGWGLHRHDQHQIAWVSHGVVTAQVGDEHWVLPPTQAIWIPSGLPHDLHNRRGSVLHCLYAWPEHCPIGWDEPTVLAITPLARELLLHLSQHDDPSPVSEAGQTMLFALLEPMPSAGLHLPLPTDPRAAAVAHAMLERPADDFALDTWAERLATSASTLRRAFLSETGLTFSEWRTQARVRSSLPLLAGRMPVERVALEVGYASTNGFVAAFRRSFGYPPGAHFRRATDR
jgi:AraC-like DNA-binding protein/quercetin dioxygenase-like cupin family protein